MKIPKTTAVSVTYGDRHEMCLDMISRALTNGVERVVLVCNGVSPDSARAIEAKALELADAIDVIWLPRNLGTAPAFAAGIKRALSTDSDYVWLLDDDNIAAPDCLEKAFTLLRSENSKHDTLGPTVACFRDTDEHHVMIAEGAALETVFLNGGQFFGFDLIDRMWPSRHRLAHEVDGSLPQAPYGGLLIDRQVLNEIGPPREDFILYFDDVALTRAMRSNGIRILLCPEARIRDAGAKWVDTTKVRYLNGMIAARNPARTYYSYRNSFVLDWEEARRRGRRLRFVLNWAVYSAYVLAATARAHDGEFLGLYLRACRDAATGRMGERLPLSLV